MQLIGSSEPDKPWLLKYPVHMKHLRSFLEVYPDALVIWTHRDPAKVMSSYASLLAGFRALNVTRVDRNDITREQMEIWASGAERAIQVRAGAQQAQFYDLHFNDFVKDPVGSAQRIYETFGIEWTPECETALRAWSDENPQEKHGKHGHSLDAIETTRDEMLERFAAYIDHFNVAVGSVDPAIAAEEHRCPAQFSAKKYAATARESYWRSRREPSPAVFATLR